MTQPIITGGCLCGAIRYTISQPVMIGWVMHSSL